MFKKGMALTLAALMFLNPMTAFAVTWGEVVTELNMSGRYNSEEGIEAEANDGSVTVTGTGEITDFNTNNDDFSSYTFMGDIEINGDEFLVYAYKSDYENGEETARTSKDVTVTLGEGVSVNATGNLFVESSEGSAKAALVNEGDIVIGDHLNVFAWGSAGAELQNKGTISGEVYGSAEDHAHVSMVNDGTITNGEFGLDVNGDATGAITNNSTVDNMLGSGMGNGSLTMTNSGNVNDSISIYANGESETTLNNTDTGVANAVNIWAEETGTITADNQGTVTDGIEGHTDGHSTVEVTNAGSTAYMHFESYDNANLAVKNDSDIGDGFIYVAADGSAQAKLTNSAEVDYLNVASSGDKAVEVENNGSVRWTDADVHGDSAAGMTASGTGTMQDAQIRIITPTADTLTPDQVKAIVSKVTFPNGTTPEVRTCVELENADGEIEKVATAIYRIDENGNVTLVEVLGEEEAEYIPDDPAHWSKERIRHKMEEKRKAQAIGGVYGSPYWLKQLYLGYMSLNLRLFEGEKQLLFKESLSWLVEERAKQITFRIKPEEPKDLTMRLDGAVIDVLERTEISTIAIVDGDGDLFMEYKVADLKGAREKYGLAREDYIVVGAADADVMKIGADGKLVPIE